MDRFDLTSRTGGPTPRRVSRRLRLAGVVAAVALVLAGCGGGDEEPATSRPADGEQGGEQGRADGDMMGRQDMGAETADVPRVPPVFGYYNGEDIFFIHTEASDEEIAQVLETMMGSPVPVVASLTQAPARALATVYVFTNGIRPEGAPAGPLGFQPDVFDTAPGEPDYTPLRRLVRVTWRDESHAEVLTSAEQIEQAEADGTITLEASDVVVNMPFLTWPGGQR